MEDLRWSQRFILELSTMHQATHESEWELAPSFRVTSCITFNVDGAYVPSQAAYLNLRYEAQYSCRQNNTALICAYLCLCLKHVPCAAVNLLRLSPVHSVWLSRCRCGGCCPCRRRGQHQTPSLPNSMRLSARAHNYTKPITHA